MSRMFIWTESGYVQIAGTSTNRDYVKPDTNKTTNCPNCGAPITSSKCEYCETDFRASAMWGMAM